MSEPVEADWRASRRRRFTARAIAVAGSRAVRVLGPTWTWRAKGVEHLEAVARSGRPPIMAFWHGRIIPAAYYFRRRGIVVITSDNFDGEWAAGIIERLGFGTARGSTSRGAKRALLQLKRAMAAGRSTAFTLDGPRGPARRAQPGALWLAKATGNPILAFHIEAGRHWTLSSWDRTQIPKPFSRVAIVIQPPLYVAQEADEQQLEAARIRLERELAEAEQQSVALVSSREPRTEN
jgi:lysophospholipid acyltransferase (LPLAT)-like uncharacterized protein